MGDGSKDVVICDIHVAFKVRVATSNFETLKNLGYFNRDWKYYALA
jgi:hypothetical protein